MASGKPVILYSQRDYQGTSLDLDYGNYPNIWTNGFPNDALQSIRVAPFTSAQLFENGSYGGRSITIDGPKDIPILDDYGSGFGGIMSSLIIKYSAPNLVQQVNCCKGITNSSQCGRWQPGSLSCESSMTSWCGTSLGTDPVCKSWCSNNNNLCDQIVNNFCKSQPNDPYCSCINSPAQKTGAVNPKCVDKKCITSGYLTSPMKDTNCPSIINCNIKTTLENSGVILSYDVPMQQNCGGTSGTKQNTPGAGTSTVTKVIKPVPVVPPPDRISLILIWIQENLILFILIVILFVSSIVSVIYMQEIIDIFTS